MVIFDPAGYAEDIHFGGCSMALFPTTTTSHAPDFRSTLLRMPVKEMFRLKPETISSAPFPAETCILAVPPALIRDFADAAEEDEPTLGLIATKEPFTKYPGAPPRNNKTPQSESGDR
jgi:hypothetical protein